MISPNLLSIATDTAHLPLIIPWPRQRIKRERLIPEGKEKVTLRHQKRAFVGCFSLRLKKNINWELFKKWKETRSPSITHQIARDFLPFIRNHYDYLTTAPPSGRRNPSCYCVYDLASAISRLTTIPFVPAFAQKTDKLHHGRFASLVQSKPELLKSWNIQRSSILFIDDCITSGTTARLCYQALVSLGNHVDGLIWVNAGT